MYKLNSWCVAIDMVYLKIMSFQVSNGMPLLMNFIVLVLSSPAVTVGSPLQPVPQGNSIQLTLAKALLVLVLSPVTSTWPVNQQNKMYG